MVFRLLFDLFLHDRDSLGLWRETWLQRRSRTCTELRFSGERCLPPIKVSVRRSWALKNTKIHAYLHFLSSITNWRKRRYSYSSKWKPTKLLSLQLFCVCQPRRFMHLSVDKIIMIGPVLIRYTVFGFRIYRSYIGSTYTYSVVARQI